MRWRELTGEVIQTLRSDAGAAHPQARNRACVLALDHLGPLDVEGTLALAELSLGAFDERLALRAAQAVIDQSAATARAHRVAAQAASALGELLVADAHFDAARRCSDTPTEHAVLALAQADHLGIRHHNAPAALEVIRGAITDSNCPHETAQLELAANRWATVAGQSADLDVHVGLPTDAATASSLIMSAMSTVISGPLSDAERAIAQLRRMPQSTLDFVPGGAALLEITEVMALSNTGDVLSARRRLRAMIDTQATETPRGVGLSAYALGFSELFSGEADQAYRWASVAVEHLRWRDLAGLLPAAKALLAASSCAADSNPGSDQAPAEIPDSAKSDPKVIMLQAWAAARSACDQECREEAAELLLQGAHLMLTTRHTFFAGILGHCVARLGTQVPQALTMLEEASSIAGGGLLDLMVRHARAVLDADIKTLKLIAGEAEELGLLSTAADSYLNLARLSEECGAIEDRDRFARAAEQLLTQTPSLVLWQQLV